MTEEVAPTPKRPPPPTPPAATPTAPPVAKPKTEITLMLETRFPLQDPDTGIWFREGQPVKVPRITQWMQGQIDARIMVILP